MKPVKYLIYLRTATMNFWQARPHHQCATAAAAVFFSTKSRQDQDLAGLSYCSGPDTLYAVLDPVLLKVAWRKKFLYINSHYAANLNFLFCHSVFTFLRSVLLSFWVKGVSWASFFAVVFLTKKSLTLSSLGREFKFAVWWEFILRVSSTEIYPLFLLGQVFD